MSFIVARPASIEIADVESAYSTEVSYLCFFPLCPGRIAVRTSPAVRWKWSSEEISEVNSSFTCICHLDAIGLIEGGLLNLVSVVAMELQPGQSSPVVIPIAGPCIPRESDGGNFEFFHIAGRLQKAQSETKNNLCCLCPLMFIMKSSSWAPARKTICFLTAVFTCPFSPPDCMFILWNYCFTTREGIGDKRRHRRGRGKKLRQQVRVLSQGKKSSPSAMYSSIKKYRNRTERLWPHDSLGPTLV